VLGFGLNTRGIRRKSEIDAPAVTLREVTSAALILPCLNAASVSLSVAYSPMIIVAVRDMLRISSKMNIVSNTTGSCLMNLSRSNSIIAEDADQATSFLLSIFGTHYLSACWVVLELLRCEKRSASLFY
jgi:hypothetical protein